MPKTRFRIPSIEGLTPAIDPRSEDKIYVLDGRNFLFDSKGPKSGFGTRFLAEGQQIEPRTDGIVQTIDIGKQAFVFTAERVWRLSEDGLSYEMLVELDTSSTGRIDPWKKKWTAAYLSQGVYFAHPDYGLFKQEKGILVHKDENDIPGLPWKPQAVAETNGRLVVLGIEYVGWSGPSQAEDFTPRLGGAGQQKLSDVVAGFPVTLEGFDRGFLAWTEQDCLLGEFIGGNNVFRFDRTGTKQLPLGAWSVEALPDSSQLICTKQGIHRIVDGREPENVTPVFNEYFRDFLKDVNFRQVRINYIMEQDLLYVQLMDWTNHYVHTFVLSLALDRWGTFDERHRGIFRYRRERGAWGYMDNEGRTHKFVEYLYFKETEPGVLEGLDSFVELGYVKPPELQKEVDTLLEMQELLLGSQPSRPSWSEIKQIDLGPMPRFWPPLAADEGVYELTGQPLSSVTRHLIEQVDTGSYTLIGRESEFVQPNPLIMPYLTHANRWQHGAWVDAVSNLADGLEADGLWPKLYRFWHYMDTLIGGDETNTSAVRYAINVPNTSISGYHFPITAGIERVPYEGIRKGTSAEGMSLAYNITELNQFDSVGMWVNDNIDDPAFDVSTKWINPPHTDRYVDLRSKSGGNATVHVKSNTGISFANPSGAALIGGTRSGDNVIGYLNGVNQGSVNAPVLADHGPQMTVTYDKPAELTSPRKVAIFFLALGLTDTDWANMHTHCANFVAAMAALDS